jgi:bacteriophage CI repressor protein
MNTLYSPGVIPVFELRHRVRLAREHASLSQGELAEASGLSRPGIAKIEQGSTKPRRTTLLLIALATGVDSYWLETGESPKTDTFQAAHPPNGHIS